MTTSQTPRKRLPENPSEENLRKQATALAREKGLQLAAATAPSRQSLPESAVRVFPDAFSTGILHSGMSSDRGTC
jgi:hypothetical protein